MTALWRYHLADLSRSGLTAEDAAAAGMWSADAAQVSDIVKFTVKNGGIVIPYPGTDAVRVRMIPELVFEGTGKSAKYLSPKGARVRLYIPPGVLDELRADPTRPPYFAEGEKKALAIRKALGVSIIAVAGVWGFANKERESGVIEDIEGLLPLLRNRPVVIAFDADARTNLNVARAAEHFARWAREKAKAKPLWAFPERDGDKKVGIDDLFVAHGADAVRALFAAARSPEDAASYVFRQILVEVAKSPREASFVGTALFYRLRDALRDAAAELRPALAEEARVALKRSTQDRVALLAAARDIAPDAPEHGDQPAIIVRNEFAAVTDEAVAALAAAPTSPLYVRGGGLVRVVRDGVDRGKWIKHPIGAPVIAGVTLSYLRETMDRCAAWATHGPNGAIKSALPPEWAAKAILERGVWPFAPLAGVSEVPVLREDGTVFDTPGYDAASSMYYDAAFEVPRIPEFPTRDDALRALRIVLDPIVDMAFANPTAQAAAVALVLTILARAAIRGPTPGYCIRAPLGGAGKTLLALVLTIAGTGRTPAMLTMPPNEEELGKILLAIGLAGDRVVLIDNADGVVGSNAFSMALTTTTFTGRLLGASKNISVPLRPVWVITGNNTRFKSAFGRRIIPIDLDPKCENPEDRGGFRHERLLLHVESIRAELIAAALTILRAFAVAGRPRHRGKRMGSFEDWDDLVRSCVVWLGLSDPGATDDPQVGRGRMRADGDEDVEALRDLLRELRRAFEDRAFVTGDVLARFDSEEGLPPDQALRAALAGVIPGGEARMNSRAVGNAFRASRDREVGGLRLESAGKIRGGYAAWRVCGDSPSTEGQPEGGGASEPDGGPSSQPGARGESPSSDRVTGEARRDDVARDSGSTQMRLGAKSGGCKVCGEPVFDPALRRCAFHSDPGEGT